MSRILDQHGAVLAIRQGANLPFDASDEWWTSDATRMPPRPVDWAHAAARGIIYELMSRPKPSTDAFYGIDEATRIEIVQALANIIREAQILSVL